MGRVTLMGSMATTTAKPASRFQADREPQNLPNTDTLNLMSDSNFPLDEDRPQEGNGAAHIPLSEAITAVLDVLDGCAGDLSAVRHWLRRQELPEDLNIDESELPRPAEQARHIAAQLEECAGALRNASGEVGDQPGMPPGG
jgi:hypothetical protein